MKLIYLGCDTVNGSQGFLVQIWGTPFQHLYNHNAQAPDVHLVAILFPVGRQSNTCSRDIQDWDYFTNAAVAQWLAYLSAAQET